MHRNLRILYVLIALTAALGLVMQMQQPAGLLGNVDGTDFAVEDTSLVDRIFIADMDGNQVLLERPEKGRLWDVNGQFKAREDAIDLLLKTFKRTTVQGPVAQAAQPNVIRLLAARGKKVEVYQGGDQPVKTWYVGTATPSHTGTYMLLETPAGKADEPFVVHMEGFTGFLSTRFFTNLEEWRYTGMFDFPARTLQSVKFTHAETSSEGYTLTKGEDGQLELANPKGSRSRTWIRQGSGAISCVSRRSTWKRTTRVWTRRCKTACGRRRRTLCWKRRVQAASAPPFGCTGSHDRAWTETQKVA